MKKPTKPTLPGKKSKSPKKDVSARTAKAKKAAALPGDKTPRRAGLPGKNSTKALPPGKKPKAPKDRRQSTKKARPEGKKIPPAPPVVDPRIVAIRQVADWILRGENEVSIEEAIKTTFPKENPIELLADAFRYIGELAGTDPELRRTWHVAARRELYRRTVEIHDFKTARDILRDLAQLEGLYPKMAPTKSKTKTDDQAEDVGELAADPMEGYPLVQ